MGYIAHHAIIVTAYDAKRVETARAKALEIGLDCTEIIVSRVNGYATFLIPPDGSKEGWGDSEQGNGRRAAWVKWVRETPNLWVDWVLLRYGGDDPEFADIEDHNGKEAEALPNDQDQTAPNKT